MDIEIAGRDLWMRTNWYDCKFYLFAMGAGWRFPTKEELTEVYLVEKRPIIVQNELMGLNFTWTDESADQTAIGYWSLNASVQAINKDLKGLLIPVRTKQ